MQFLTRSSTTLKLAAAKAMPWPQHSALRYFSAKAKPAVAMVLSGSGVFDGTEIQESVSAIMHLSRKGATIKYFAPDKDQSVVMNHAAGEQSNETRNVLVESARISRGGVSPLDQLKADDFDAVIFPGGFGAAHNLSNFAVAGEDLQVDPQVENVIKSFHRHKKPIGLCCIAPVLAAKCIPGVTVTVGSDEEEGGKWPFAGTAGAIDSLGAKHVVKPLSDAHVDRDNLVVTSPAYMCGDCAPHQVQDSVAAMVDGVLELVEENER